MQLSTTELDRREAFCRELAYDAARLALDGFQRQMGQPVGMKGPQDYLTETDGEVERHIRDRIAATFPHDAFLGEETGADAAAGAKGAVVWVVDPIDGTANFARAIPHFCVSISLVANDEIQIGAIVNPATDDLFFARMGRGATLNGHTVRVAATDDIRAASFELGWSPRIPAARYIGALSALLEAGSNVRRGASGALALAYVACGRSDGYAELHMNSWDCLAGLLLVQEAGGIVGPFLSRGGLFDGAPVLAAVPALAGVLSQSTGIPILSGLGRISSPVTVNI